MKLSKKNVIAFGVTMAAVAAGSVLAAGGRSMSPRDVAITGRVVDLQCFMSEKFPSADHTKCTADCIRAGVPAGLETEDGLVIIGQGMKGPQSTIVPFAWQNVELTGKLYERHGVRYIDVTSAKAARTADAGSWDHEDDEDEEGEDEEN